jgi:molecular chaperone Hsp33
MVSGEDLTVIAAGDDSVLPFQLDALNIRGRVARLDGVLDKILRQRDYPPRVAALIGEAILLTTLIGSGMKLRGRVSMQCRGKGAVSLIATDYFAPTDDKPAARIRGYAHYNNEAEMPKTSDAPAALLGEAMIGLIIDQGGGVHPYQGMTPASEKRLSEGGLSAGAETYFAQSEQIATRFRSVVGLAEGASGGAQWRGGGVMIQHLGSPGEGADPPDVPSGDGGLMRADDIAEMNNIKDDWCHASVLLDTVEEIELIGPHVTPEQLLFRLFHEVTPRVYPPSAIEFGCTCSREKVQAVLENYSAETLADMVDDSGEIIAACQFCSEKYVFDPALTAAR